MYIEILKGITRKILQIHVAKKPVEEIEKMIKRYLINTNQTGKKE